MFVGHFAVGFATRKVAPRVSLGTLFLAALPLDGIWPILVLAGIERHRADVQSTAPRSALPRHQS